MGADLYDRLTLYMEAHLGRILQVNPFGPEVLEFSD